MGACAASCTMYFARPKLSCSRTSGATAMAKRASGLAIGLRDPIHSHAPTNPDRRLVSVSHRRSCPPDGTHPVAAPGTDGTISFPAGPRSPVHSLGTDTSRLSGLVGAWLCYRIGDHPYRLTQPDRQTAGFAMGVSPKDLDWRITGGTSAG